MGGMMGLRNDDPITENPQGGRESATSFRFDLLDPAAMMRLAHRMKVGVDKGYEPDNWRKVGERSHLNHALMHIMAHLMEDSQDDHLEAAFCRLMMAVGVREYRLSPLTSLKNTPWDSHPDIQEALRVQPKGCSVSPPGSQEGYGMADLLPVEFVYLAHPYAENPDLNVLRARELGGILQHHLRGEGNNVFVLIPHLFCQHMKESTERPLILWMCRAVVSLCSTLYVGGGDISEGMIIEIKEARRRGIPVKKIYRYNDVLSISDLEGEE